MIPRDAAGFLAEPTARDQGGARAGPKVVGWTFRRKNNSLAADFRVDADPAGIGDLAGEIMHSQLLPEAPPQWERGHRRQDLSRIMLSVTTFTRRQQWAD